MWKRLSGKQNAVSSFFMGNDCQQRYNILCNYELLPDFSKQLLGENGDKLVGKWKATVSGTEIDCERSDTINNGYMCTFKGYQVPVTWESDVFTWNYGSVTGTITIESDGYTQRMTWNAGWVWRKNVGKFELI